MNTAAQVDQLTERLKSGGIPLSEQCWQTAMACVGWPYVYSAWGAECTPAERKKRYNMTGIENIVAACQVLDGRKRACDGCKWYPDGCRVRCFDCRGFAEWVIEQITGWKLYGETVASQWEHDDNWCKKGQIGKDPIPQGVLVNMFIWNGIKWTHTGLYFNGSTCECSSGVQYFETMKKNRWTHWAVAKPFKNEMEAGDMPKPGYAEVTAANGKPVNLRAEPSKKAKVLTRVKVGEEVKLEPKPDSEWEYVSYQGKFGWMMREFLQE